MTTTLLRPAEFAGATSRELARQQRAAKKAARRVSKLRQKASAEIDRLLEFLDASDPYVSTELEEAADDIPCDTDELEAEFATTMIEDRKPGGGSLWSAPWHDGAEADAADDEPSLGAPENHVMGSPPGIWAIKGQYACGSGNQSNWTQGNSDDREDDAGDNCEEDPAESGIGDAEGYVEQLTGEPSLGWTVDGFMGGTDLYGVDREQGEPARRPQNRTHVASTMKGARSKITRSLRERFDLATRTASEINGDTLRGGELSYPGGQGAFDAILRNGNGGI